MKHSNLIRGLGLACMMAAGPALAYDFNIVTPNQHDFHLVAQDLTGAFDYKALGGAASGGLLGFSIDGFGSYTRTLDSGAWKRLTGSSVDGVGIAGIRASTGLLGVDVGGFYAAVPGTNANVYGAELRTALFKGTVVTPAVALRGTYTAASNTGDVSYDSYGADLIISKGFLFITPYAGAGYVQSVTKTDRSVGLDKESIGRGKGFVGLAFKMLLLDGTVDYERLGRSNVYSLKLGVTF